MDINILKRELLRYRFLNPLPLQLIMKADRFFAWTFIRLQHENSTLKIEYLLSLMESQCFYNTLWENKILNREKSVGKTPQKEARLCYSELRDLFISVDVWRETSLAKYRKSASLIRTMVWIHKFKHRKAFCLQNGGKRNFHTTLRVSHYFHLCLMVCLLLI